MSKCDAPDPLVPHWHDHQYGLPITRTIPPPLVRPMTRFYPSPVWTGSLVPGAITYGEPHHSHPYPVIPSTLTITLNNLFGSALIIALVVSVAAWLA